MFVYIENVCGNRGVCSSGQESVFLYTRKLAFTREGRRIYIMPVLESTEFTTPRSALRHRPIGDDSKQQERLSPNTSAPTPIVQRASRTRTTTDASVEVDEWQRASGNSAGSVAAQPHIRRSNATTGPKTLSKTPIRKQNATHRLPKA